MEGSSEKVKWYFTKKALVIGLLAVGPFALPLLWFNPRYRVASKLIWTAVILGLTYAFGALTGWLNKTLMDQLGFSSQ